MRGAPHVGFSATMRKISSRNSRLTHFLPTWVLRREIQAQYNLKPSRCQRTTVSGWTRINARFHPGHSRRHITEKSLAGAANCGRGRPCLRTPSCCRRARFSKSRSRRERKTRTNRKGTRLRRRTIRPVFHELRPVGPSCHLLDLKADHYFGESLDSWPSSPHHIHSSILMGTRRQQLCRYQRAPVRAHILGSS